MRPALNVLFLLTDGYGSYGGISQFNRDFLSALAASDAVDRVDAIPRLVPHPILEEIPSSVAYDPSAARGKASFVRRAIERALIGAGPDVVICGHLHLLPFACLIAKVRHVPLFLIIHGIEAWQPTHHVLANRLVSTVDGVLAVSRFSADKFASWSGVPSESCTILPNCVDLARFTPQERDRGLAARYGIVSDKVIMTLGSLSSKERRKGFDEVLEAIPQLINRHSKLKYMIVGSGPDQGRLMRRAEALGVADRVVFTGRIAEDEKVAHYSLADIFAMPSVGEGFGIVLLEAAACGVPVVGSNADGSREALRDGLLGRLVDPDKPEELVEAVGHMLDCPTVRRRPTGIEEFTVDRFRGRVECWLRDQFKGQVVAGRNAASWN